MENTSSEDWSNFEDEDTDHSWISLCSDGSNSDCNNEDASQQDPEQQCRQPKVKVENLLDSLTAWKITYNISARATSALLSILRKFGHFDELPEDCRTLMKTPRNTDALCVTYGEHRYIHFGLEASLREYLQHCRKIPDFLDINISLDGLPLSHSSKQKFYPLQGAVVEERMKPFIIGTVSRSHMFVFLNTNEQHSALR